MSHFIISNVFPISSSWVSGDNGMFFRETEMHINWFVLLYCRILHQGKSIISAFSGMLTFNLGLLVSGGISGWWSLCFHFVSKYCSFWVLLSSVFRPDELLSPFVQIPLYHLLFEPLIKNHVTSFKLWKVKPQK